MPEPRVEHIRDLFDHVTKTFINGAQGQQDQFFLGLYFQDFSIFLPDTKDKKRSRQFEMDRMRLAEGTRIVDVIDSRYATPPYLGVMPVDQGAHAPVVRDEIEWGLNEIVDQLNPGSAGQGPYGTGVFQQVLLGRRAELILPGHEYYWDFPFRRIGQTEEAWWDQYEQWEARVPVPILWQGLPAETTFAPDLSSLDDEAVSTQRMTWRQLTRIFSEQELAQVQRDDQRQSVYEEYTVAIYSDRNWISWAVMQGTPESQPRDMSKDAIVRTIEHKLGRSAIRILPGMTTGRKEPGKYFKSVLYSVADMIMQAERVSSLVLTSEKLRTLPTILAYLRGVNDNEEGAKARIRQFQESDMWMLDAGDKETPPESMSALLQPDASAEALNFLAFVLGRVSRVSHTPPVLEGDMGSSGTPAWSINFAAELAKGGLADLTRAIGAAHLDSSEGIIRSIAAFGEKVPLTRFEGEKAKNIVLDPDRLSQYKPILKAEFQPKIPINQRADYALFGQLAPVAMQFGVPSISWLAERLLGVERPWEMFRDQITWQWMTSDPIRNAMGQDILKEAMAIVDQDEEMGGDQAEALLAMLPEPLRSALMAQMQMGGGPGGPQRNGGSMGGLGMGGGSPDLQGAVRSATMTQPGGPKPQEQMT